MGGWPAVAGQKKIQALQIIFTDALTLHSLVLWFLKFRHSPEEFHTRGGPFPSAN
jgi:hypothetical protein